MKITFDSQPIFHDLRFLEEDRELKDAAYACVQSQKEAASARTKSSFVADPDALTKVSPQALDEILSEKRQVSDIRTNTEISNCIVFHTTNLEGSLIDEQVLAARKRADRIVVDRLKEVFDGQCSAAVSGHFWYPAGGFMGWHTNLRKPGWRMYVSYAEEPGCSFFRYRDPATGAIVTCVDRDWNFRLFRITPAEPFWHAVYSETNRFSLGYMVTEGI